MRIFFVDGGVRSTDRGKDGAAGAVVLHPGNPFKITGYGRYFAAGEPRITNQRMEIEAVRLAADMAEDGESIAIWSDSTYAINTLTPGSGWRPNANLDLIAETREALMRVRVDSLQHIYGHISRKSEGKLPDHLMHELADEMAQAALTEMDDMEADVYEGPTISSRCLACARFPCEERDKDALKAAEIHGRYEGCDKPVSWGRWVTACSEMRLEGLLKR